MSQFDNDHALLEALRKINNQLVNIYITLVFGALGIIVLLAMIAVEMHH